jgi:hypothetical protein
MIRSAENSEGLDKQNHKPKSQPQPLPETKRLVIRELAILIVGLTKYDEELHLDSIEE